MNSQINCLEIVCCYEGEERDGEGRKSKIKQSRAAKTVFSHLSSRLFKGLSCTLHQKVMVLKTSHKQKEFFHTQGQSELVQVPKWYFCSKEKAHPAFFKTTKPILLWVYMCYFNTQCTTQISTHLSVTAIKSNQHCQQLNQSALYLYTHIFPF